MGISAEQLHPVIFDPVTTLAEVLARRRTEPVETSGLTAVLEHISGGPVTVELLGRVNRPLTGEEHHLLAAGAHLIGHERKGLLRPTSGPPAAEVTALLVINRMPWHACKRLGMPAPYDPGGPMPPPTGVPLGRALAGFGVVREPIGEVKRTDGRTDAAGNPQALYSSALLRLGSGILGVVTERINSAFLDAYPGPWPGLTWLGET